MSISRTFLAITALAVLLRFGVAVYLGDTTPPAKDETSYSVLAARLATGHGYSFPVGWYPFAEADTPTSHWSFLYTAFVASVFSTIGAHPLGVRLFQALLCGLLLPWLTYRLTQRLFPAHGSGEVLPLLAALLAAVYAYFVLYGAMVQTEGLFICVVLWSLTHALTLDGQLAANMPLRKVGWNALVLGLSLGLATLLRQSILPWLPLLCGWLLLTGWRVRRLRMAVGAAAIITAVVVLCIAPFTLRNLQVYGEFLLLNSNTGYAMYSAQHPLHGTDFQAYAAAPLPVDLLDKGLNEAQWDRALMQRGLGFVLAEPGRYLLLSWSRVSDYFEVLPNADSSLLFNTGQLLSFTLFLPFMLIGSFVAFRKDRFITRRRWLLLPDPVALALFFVVFYSVLHIFTWAMPRYRLPVDAVLLPFAALGILTVWQFMRRIVRRDGTQDTTLPGAETSS
jgi:hypothetical protein